MCNIDYDLERVTTSKQELETLFSLTEQAITENLSEKTPVVTPAANPATKPTTHFGDTRHAGHNPKEAFPRPR